LPKYLTVWAFLHTAPTSGYGLIKPDNSEQHDRDLLEAKSEILKLRAQLKRTEEERDILKKAARYFAREPD